METLRIALILFGGLSVFMWVMSVRPASRDARRRQFLSTYGCTVPDEWGPALDRALAVPLQVGAGALLAVLPAVVWLRTVLDTGEQVADSFALVTAYVVAFAVASCGRAVQATRPVFTDGAAIARLRAVDVSDYVPRRLRIATVAAEICAIGVCVAAWLASALGFWPEFMVWVALSAGMIALAGVVVEFAARRIARAPEQASDEPQLFVQDALRASELVLAYEGVTGCFLLTLLFAGQDALLHSESRFADSPAYVLVGGIGVTVVTAILWFVTRTAQHWYLDRLWHGQVPPAVRRAARAHWVAS